METFSPKGQVHGPIMPKSLLQRKDMSLGAKLLYGVLCSCAYKSGDHCWPSQGFLAGSMGVSIRSIQNYLGELQKLGLILVQRARFGASLKYYFLKSELITESSLDKKKALVDYSKEDAGSSYAKVAPGYAKPAYIENINNKYKINTPPSPSPLASFVAPPVSPRGGGFPSAVKSAEEGFFKIWDCWPRKEAKASALKLWKRLWFSGELLPVPAMLDTISLFKQHDPSWHRGYVPYLVNWLRAERWKEKPQAVSQAVPDYPVDVNEAQKMHDDFIRRSRENAKRMMLDSRDPRIASLAASKFGGKNAEERQR